MAATTTSHRAWEMGSSPTSAPATASPAKNQLPSIAALTGGIQASNSSGPSSPTSTRERSSGAWSSQPQSTRSSAYSNCTNGFPMHSGFNISPHRVSNSSQMGATSHPFDFGTGTSSGTPASPGFARSSNGAALPFINQHHQPNRESHHSSDFPTDSRRSSLGSQVNSGLNSLNINNTGSPYSGSGNHSTTSLAQNLSRERGITHTSGARNSRSSGQLPVSPLSPHGGEPRPVTFAPRIAPPIGRNPRSDIYNADEPIQGQAYAFPDPPNLQPGDLPPTPGQRTRDLAAIDEYGSGVFGRRDSGHTSITSSIVTSDSRLPPGQRRLDEGVRLDGPPELPGTHHHTLQQSQMSTPQADDALSADGSMPYSRTPALRVSHKMAERKRRSEMKDLFENLRSQIPSSAGSKSSKWEILTKASDYIKQLEGSSQNGQHADKQLRLACHDLEMSRRDNDGLRNENQRLMAEMQHVRSSLHQHQQQPPPPPPPQPPYSGGGGGPAHLAADPSRSLPPLTNGAGAPSSMQGIQYTHERH